MAQAHLLYRPLRSHWRFIGWSIPVVLLAIPLIAMRFTREVDWDETDFIVMGGLFAMIGLAFEGAARLSNDWFYRGGAALALLSTFLLIWLSLAVGIIGSENNDANLMFAGVIATFATGAILARFRSRGMARAALAAAAAQVLVAAIALALNLGSDGAAWPRDVIVLSTFFTALWLASFWLFSKAK